MLANAAPWSFALKQAYLADFPAESLWEVYGSTELGVDTVLAPADQLRKPGSCGLPAPGVELKLFDDDGNEVTEPGVPGELFIRSAGVFNTYHKAQDKYEEDRRGDFHTVGDVAYRDDEGYFYICDRKKDMIISGGMNIYPAEIEAALEAQPRHLRRRRVRHPQRRVGRERARGSRVRGRAPTLDDAGGHGVRPRPPRGLQGAAVGDLHRRTAAHRLGQDPQARPARTVLGRPRHPRGLAPR